MAYQPYETEKLEAEVQGIPVKNILIAGGTIIVATIIIVLFRR
jgi:hypothetical protein|tara:strand:+ start:1855 stop:1983 length:129 start_codon:yes stop_codon:yes gene_type:complete